MKKILITILMLSAFLMSQAQSPNWNEWFRQKNTQRKYLIQQIAALKVYLEYLKKGYKIVDKGLTTIGDIKNGTFNLDKDYLNSLKQVSPVVKNSPKVKEVLVYQLSITSDFRKFLEVCRKDENLTLDEVHYIEDVYQNMLKECEASIDELTVITTAGEAEMKDDERLLRLDKVSNRYDRSRSRLEPGDSQLLTRAVYLTCTGALGFDTPLPLNASMANQ